MKKRKEEVWSGLRGGTPYGKEKGAEVERI